MSSDVSSVPIDAMRNGMSSQFVFLFESFSVSTRSSDGAALMRRSRQKRDRFKWPIELQPVVGAYQNRCVFIRRFVGRGSEDSSPRMNVRRDHNHGNT